VKAKIIAEIGINHNGCINIAKKLIDVASVAGCDYVKIQKRDPDICVPEEQKEKIKITPWGEMPYIEYKHKIEFSFDQVNDLKNYASQKGLILFASVWDKKSAVGMSEICPISKIPSALITDLDLCKVTRSNNNQLLVSTGMSDETQIESCIRACDPDVIFHTNSTYPTQVSELNLAYITWLKNKWPNKKIGYSGHEFGLITTIASVVMGAEYIERHVTLDRTMWGSDQMASVEPHGLIKLVKAIRDIEQSCFQGNSPRSIIGGEMDKLLSLRGS